MKTILVATDLSQAALDAVNYAADMALSINADLLLLTVAELPVSYSDVPIVLGLEDIMRNTEKEIKKLKEEVKLRTNDKINIETEVGMGGFFNELKQVCERVKPYTVVMGSQGKTAAEHLMFGSHAVHAMKNLEWPLITVPAGSSFSSLKKIGLACDLVDELEATQIDEIKKLVNDFNAELHVINTSKPGVYNPNHVFESITLENMLKPVKPKYHFITDKNTDEGIMRFAEDYSISLLIVLPKRHSLLDKIIHRSHTKRLVLHSHVPVMALHQ